MDAPPSVDTCSHVLDTKRKPGLTTAPQKMVSYFPSCRASRGVSPALLAPPC